MHPLQAGSRRVAVGLTAGALAIAIAIAAFAAPTSAETAVGVEAGVAVEGHYLDAGLVQVLESTLDSQFIGVDVALVRGRLVLEGFATPGVHTAVLGVVARLLQQPVSVPVALGIVTPSLGLENLPLLGAGVGLEIPDLSGLLRILGVVDRIQIIR